MLLSSSIHFCMVSLFKALGRLLKALEALFRDGLHSPEHLLVGGDRSAEEAQVGLGDLGISLLFHCSSRERVSSMWLLSNAIVLSKILWVYFRLRV
jgi:hypothetical protein